MEGSLKEGIKRIRQHPVYYPQFQKAYSGDPDPVTDYNIANAISSYVRSLTHYNSRFDKYMRNEGDLTASEKKGFNLFAGKARCATCHYIPLFNGLVPPQFSETESEVIGVPANNVGAPKPDDDKGKFIFTRSTVHRHAFKTPTLRNVTLTAPYMHNGAFKSLEEVMDFYNKGGGAGTHTAFENETLPSDPLSLSKKEIKNVIAFLKTLTDEPVQR
jgi:cytochrome c peroxidase